MVSEKEGALFFGEALLEIQGPHFSFQVKSSNIHTLKSENNRVRVERKSKCEREKRRKKCSGSKVEEGKDMLYKSKRQATGRK